VKVLHRYLIREMVLYFTVVLVLVLTLFVAIDYLGRMDNFIESGISMFRALEFVLLKTPFMVVMFIPVGVLLAALVVFGIMARRNELVALRSGGVSIYQLFRPVLFFSAAAAVAMFFISETVSPIAMARANQIKKMEISKNAVLSSTEKNIWIKSEDTILYIRYYEPSQSAIYGVALNEFDDDFRLLRRIDAEKGVYRQGGWTLSGVLEQRLDPESGKYSVQNLPEQAVAMDIVPEDLRRVVKKSEEMSYRELSEHIRKVESEGYDASAYRVDLHAKIAFPFVCLIMGAVGLGIAAGRWTGRSLPGAITTGIGAAFVYWILHSFCISLGRGEILPPIVAAWAANFVFALFGAITVQSAP